MFLLSGWGWLTFTPWLGLQLDLPTPPSYLPAPTAPPFPHHGSFYPSASVTGTDLFVSLGLLCLLWSTASWDGEFGLHSILSWTKCLIYSRCSLSIGWVMAVLLLHSQRPNIIKNIKMLKFADVAFQEKESFDKNFSVCDKWSFQDKRFSTSNSNRLGLPTSQ